MATRVEKAVLDGTNVVVGYGTVNIASYNAPIPPATQGTTTYSTQDAVVDVEIDYSSFYGRIATALETIATQVTTIAAQTTTIATQSTTIAAQTTIVATQTTTVASKQTAMETYQKKLKELGETTGIHVVGPYDWLGLINVYKSLIEQGNIADTQGNISPSAQAAAEASVSAYLTKIQRIPQGF